MTTLNEANNVLLGSVPADKVYLGDVEVWPEVSPIIPIVVTATSAQWDQATVTWETLPDIEYYELHRVTTLVYTGTDSTFLATGLSPATTYAWKVSAYQGGILVGQGIGSGETAARPAPVVTASSPRWDQATVSWTDSVKGSVDSYILKRGSTQVYSGSAMTFTDSGLTPSKAYTYNLTSRRGTTTILPSASASVTSAAHPDLGLTASPVSTTQINLSWAAKNGSVDSFTLKKGLTTLYTGTGTSYSNTGLRSGNSYTYDLTAKRSSSTIKTDSASATTWSMSSASLADGRQADYGWTGTTAKTLSAANFNPGVNGWVTYFTLCVNGDTENGGAGAIGNFDPHINGKYMGYRNCASSGAYPKYTWNAVDPTDTSMTVFPGTNTIGLRTPSGTGYRTQWMSYDTNWSAHTTWLGINYSWYVTRETDDQLRALRWWDGSLAGRAIHYDGWIGEAGDVEKVKVYDKETMELIWEWESGKWNTSSLVTITPSEG